MPSGESPVYYAVAFAAVVAAALSPLAILVQWRDEQEVAFPIIVMVIVFAKPSQYALIRRVQHFSDDAKH